MKKILWLFLIGALLFACAPKEAPKPAAPVPGVEVKPIAKAGWEVEWEKLITEAKKEGTVILYSTAGGPLFSPLVKAARDKFGLRLEVTAGKSSEIIARLNTERKAGLFLADIYMGGATTTVNSLKPAGILAPLEPVLFLPDVIDPKGWYGGGLPWIDPKHLILASAVYPNHAIAINANIVGKDEIKSYKDLLNPKWKGKIVMNDPSVGGPGGSFFVAMSELIMDYEFWKGVAKQDPIITRDERLQIEWVAQGKYPIGIGIASETMADFQKAGAPLTYVMPVEGTYLTSGSAALGLINNAPHPNAAKTFLNWLLSKEGQTIFQDGFGAQSARVDISTEGLDPVTIRKPNTKYYIASGEEYLLKAPEVRLKAKEIFGIK